uniref:Histamine binding protein n=1 Tax=Ixodes scapularis TaxID=6945 RepID=Q4PMG9_IXOSC|nr:histamine binding protein [Ixodes scapularis]
MKLALSLAIFVCGVLLGTYGEMSTTFRPLGNQGSTSTSTRPGTPSARMSTNSVPPEEDPSKYKEQNATRVVEMNATQWVKWRTYNVTDVFGGNSLECENFKVMKKRTPTNYSLQYKYRSEKGWNTIDETLILKDLGRRGFYNDMNFQRTPIGIPTDNLVLYSNYINCTILRIPFTNQGERHCDLWMANMTLSQETPDECLNRFFEYCNTTKIFRVFYPNCTNYNIHFSLE